MREWANKKKQMILKKDITIETLQNIYEIMEKIQQYSNKYWDLPKYDLWENELTKN